MRYAKLHAYICAAFLVLSSSAFGQTANGSISLTSLATGQLSTPQAPTVTAHCTVGCTHTWAYEVWAVDEANGVTPASSITTITNGATSLSVSVFNSVLTYVVSGAQNCVVYRSTSASGVNGVIGTIACGTTLNDTGLTGVSATVPTVNTTGSISLSGNLSATGTATASSFIA